MKIAFICGCLEPGKDGVGDYTRRLATALIARGHAVRMISLRDYWAPPGGDPIPEESPPCFRFHDAFSKAVADAARERIAEWHPDIISLQFVCYAFNPRGHIGALTRFLAKLPKNCRFHIMFHEIWIGVRKSTSLKHKLIGRVQRREQLHLVKTIRPHCLHSHARPYRNLIGQLTGMTVKGLPLFGNIPYSPPGSIPPQTQLIPETESDLKKNSKEVNFRIGIFGTLPSDWWPISLQHLVEQAVAMNRHPVIVFFGRNRASPEQLESYRHCLQGKASLCVLGELPAEKVSHVLQQLDCAFAMTDLRFIEKSGSVAAMLEHGLPVLACAEEPVAKTERFQDPLLFDMKDLDLKLLFELPKLPYRNFLDTVAEQFIEDIQSSLQKSTKPRV